MDTSALIELAVFSLFVVSLKAFGLFVVGWAVLSLWDLLKAWWQV